MKTLISASVIAMIGSISAAQDTGDVTVGLGLSTFGLNLEGTYQIDPQWRARGAFIGGFSADFDETDDGDTIEGDIKIGGLAALADYYPIQNGWRISGGLFLSNTEFDATGTVDGDSATVTGEFNNSVAPMITTGYDYSFGNGWALTSEIGAIFTGGIDLEFEAENPADQADIDNDPDVQDAISDADDIVALPYISIGVSYRY